MNIIRNLKYTISSNLISLFISMLVILIIPKVISIEEYGYWQLYIFYSSYVGFLHFGWNDGIYLRFGGSEYENLDKNLFHSQFIELLFCQLFLSLLICLGTFLLVKDNNRLFILLTVAIVMVLVNIRLMFYYVLQATNRIRVFAMLTMLDRVVYILLIIIFLILGTRNYKLFIIADLIAKFISLFFAMLSCREIVFKKMSSFYLTFSESIMNISIGIKLMFSNIASMLIIGIVRFGIERTWNVETFGKVSLTLSISNMMMVFINAVGIIMFPILRKTNTEKLSNIYITIRDILMLILLGFLTVYFPLRSILALWLPHYVDSLKYMSLVFPMFIYEGKMALLINTYLKTLRKEKYMLKINVFSMLLSLTVTYISTQLISNLDLAILNIVILLSIRSTLAENYLVKELHIGNSEDSVLEGILILVFILSGWYLNSWLTVLIYAVVYLIYVFIKRKKISRAIFKLKLITRT